MRHYFAATAFILVMAFTGKSSAQNSAPDANQAVSIAKKPAPAVVSPEKTAKIIELLTLTKIKPNLEKELKTDSDQLNWYANVQVNTLKGIPKEKENKEKEITEIYSKDMAAIATKQLKWENIQASIIQYCAANFTDEQMDSIISFYQSPIGILMMEKGQTLTRKSYDSLHSLQIETRHMTDNATEKMLADVKLLSPVPTHNNSGKDSPQISTHQAN